MDIHQFPTISISENKLTEFANLGENVLLIGPHGTGKTERVKNVFNKLYKHWQYFSGPTLDPWTDVVGVPKEKMDEKTGVAYLDYILPRKMDDQLEAIFIDEFNRTDDMVKNALMELSQFGSINGRRFPNLKVVWAAINPPPNEDDPESEKMQYLVSRLDPAQIDRFPIIVNVSPSPSLKHFSTKHGRVGRSAVDWWKNQASAVQRQVSPRRLEKCISLVKNGVSLKYALPMSADIASLTSALSFDEVRERFNDWSDNKISDIDILKDQEVVSRYREAIFSKMSLNSVESMVKKNQFPEEFLEEFIGLASFCDMDKVKGHKSIMKSLRDMDSKLLSGLESFDIGTIKVNFSGVRNYTGDTNNIRMTVNDFINNIRRVTPKFEVSKALCPKVFGELNTIKNPDVETKESVSKSMHYLADALIDSINSRKWDEQNTGSSMNLCDTYRLAFLVMNIASPSINDDSFIKKVKDVIKQTTDKIENCEHDLLNDNSR